MVTPQQPAQLPRTVPGQGTKKTDQTIKKLHPPQPVLQRTQTRLPLQTKLNDRHCQPAPTYQRIEFGQFRSVQLSDVISEAVKRYPVRMPV